MRRSLPLLLALLLAGPAWAQQPSTSYASRFRFIETGCTLRSGSGPPEGVVVGSVCDVYVRQDTSGLNPAIYTKQTGTLTNTGWVAVGGSSMVYPGAGVANSTGSAWGTSYTVGTAANNLVQLNGSSQLPAVSGALLTNLPAPSWPITAPNGGKLTAGTSAADNVCLAAWDTDTGPTDLCLLTATSGATPSLTALFGAGSLAAPSLSFINDTNTGFAWSSDNYFDLVSNGTRVGQFGPGGVAVFQPLYLNDSPVYRESAGVIQFGLDAAAPTAQVLKGPDRISSDGVGASTTLAGGRGRGNIGGVVKIQTAPTAAAGAAGVLADRVIVDTSGDVTVGSSIGTGVGALYAGTYYSGTTAGVDCTSAAAVTTSKGIVTACSAPDPLLTPQALAAEIAALKQQIAELQAALGLGRTK